VDLIQVAYFNISTLSDALFWANGQARVVSIFERRLGKSFGLA